jgi:hypothetical protein
LKVSIPGQSAWLPKHLRLGGSELVVGPLLRSTSLDPLDRTISTFITMNNRACRPARSCDMTSEKMKAAMEAAGISGAR